MDGVLSVAWIEVTQLVIGSTGIHAQVVWAQSL